MGILDDAIREHLDLKRRHGARDAELREIEDEAFGSGEQPDPFAAGELFNEPSAPAAAQAQAGEAPSAAPPDLSGLGEPEAGREEPTRLVEPEALRRPEPEPSMGEPLSPPEGLDEIPGQVELPGQDVIPGQERLEEPPEGLRPARELETEEPVGEAVPAPEPPGPSESLEDLIAEEEPFPEDVAAPPAPSPEEAAPPAEAPESELTAPPEPTAEPEPERGVPEPPPPPPDSGPEPAGRARGRIDVPTEEHPPPGQTGGVPAVPAAEPEPLEPEGALPADEELPEVEPLEDDESAGESSGSALYDFESDEEPLSGSPAPADDDFEALGPPEEEAPYLEEEEPYAEEPDEPYEEPGTAVRPALEDEEPYEGSALDPEEAYEEEEGEEGLWFEKGPPQDFDFE